MDNFPIQAISQKIYLIRGQRVMLDQDLAALYGVETRVLNQAVRRNLPRFPEDFMFQLTEIEAENLRSQIVISKTAGGRQYAPYVFTEQGIAMLSSVLKSETAIQVNIEIMRAFVQLKLTLETNAELSQKLAELEAKYDAKFKVVFDAIKQMMVPVGLPATRRKIGLKSD